MKILRTYYDPLIIILAILSVSLLIMESLAVLNLSLSPFREIDVLILLLFTYDYINRLIRADQKGQFFKKNIMDLVAIIPFHSVFAFFV